MTNLNAVFQFGVDNGYPQIIRLRISPLKESRTIRILFRGKNLSVLSMRAEISKQKIYGVFLFILEFILVSCVHLDGRT